MARTRKKKPKAVRKKAPANKPVQNKQSRPVKRPVKKEEKTRPAPKRKKAEKRGGKIIKLRPFRRVGSAMPRGLKAYFGKMLKFAGIRDDTNVWLGTSVLFAILLGFLSVFLYLIVWNPSDNGESILLGVGWWLVGFLLISILFYFSLFFKVVNRASALEKVLPDFLLLIVSNLRAGMSPFSAFVRAAKPEFGALHEEVKMSAARATGTASLVETLQDMSDHFDSRLFNRTIRLFAKGIGSGGQLTKLLRASADEAQHIQDLRAELASTTRTYTMFLGFITTIIMPFLLSVSTLFVAVFISYQPETNVSGEAAMGGIPTFSGKILITTWEMMAISIGTLIITSLMVSSLSGIISKGRALYGIKYFPIFAIISVIFYLIAHEVLGSMLMGFSG